jgi:hypothetical protein
MVKLAYIRGKLSFDEGRKINKMLLEYVTLERETMV